MGRTYKLTGGEGLEKALTLLAAKAKNSALLNVGFKEGATEDDGQPSAMVAFLNEYGRTVTVLHPKGEVAGSYYQMPRPFFRRMIAKHSPHWSEDLGKLLKAEDFDAVAALKLLGEDIADALKQSIQELSDPPLAPSTIKKKGFSKPLINSSVMWKNVDFWVSNDEEEK
jgi:hypothetical protein